MGLVLFVVGFLGIVLLTASLTTVNGISGIYAGIEFMKMQVPFGASILLTVAGLALAVKEAFFRK